MSGHTEGVWRFGWITTRGVTGPRAAPGVHLDLVKGVRQLPIHVKGADGDLPVAWLLTTDKDDDLEADARRICACVNACVGMTTDDLEAVGVGGIKSAIKVNERREEAFMQQRDELLEACKTFHEWVRREEEGFAKAGRDRSTPEGEAAWREWYDENLRLCSLAQEQARAAIAKATGEVTK